MYTCISLFDCKGLFPVQYLRKVVKEFPRHAIGDPVAPYWHESHVAVQNKKLECTNEHCMGPVIHVNKL